MAMNDFEFVSSAKGTQKLIHDKFMWTIKNIRKDGVSVWRCTERNAHGCQAMLHTKVASSGEMVRVKMTEHNHECNPEQIVRVRADSAVRKSAVDALYEVPQNIIADTVAEIPLQHHANINEAQMRRSIYFARKRVRAEFEPEGGVYTNLQDLVLPEPLLQSRGETILLADSGPSDHRIVVFGVRRHLPLLHEATSIVADGTFQVVPSLWKQQYTLHCVFRGYNVPVLYFLLPGKSKAIYAWMLRMLQDLAGSEFHCPWLTDFEASMIGAHREVLPGSSSRGCFFHLTQAIHRKVDSMGYRERYTTDLGFKRRVLALSSLAFLPLSWVGAVLGLCCPGWGLSWVGAVLGGGCPGSGLSWVWAVLGGGCPGWGAVLGGGCPGSGLSWVGAVLGLCGPVWGAVF